MDEKLTGSNSRLLNDQGQCTDYRKEDLLSASRVVGSPAYADWRVSVVISWGKGHIFIKHVDYTKLEEKIRNGTQSDYWYRQTITNLDLLYGSGKKKK